MKKLIAAITLLMLTNGLIAQTFMTNAGGLYVKGGVNLANISTHSNGTVDEGKTLTSFHVGLVGDVPLSSFVSFQPGLLLTGKGSKAEIYLDEDNRDDNFFKLKTNPLYIEVPANLVFKLPTATGTRFFVGAGPYVAMGIGGKTKGERKILGVTSSYEQDIEFNNDDPFTSGQEDASVNKLRRFDMGVNGLAGVEMGKLLLGINYGHGLSKIGSSENSNEDDKNKHRLWSISLGFKL